MDARALLKQYGIRPSKELGQNLLVNQAILEKIVTAAELTPNDTVLEIGAGDGRMTWRYAEKTAHVTGIDPNPDRIAAAIDNCPPALRTRVVFQVCGIEDFEPNKSSPGFDVAMLSWTL